MMRLHSVDEAASGPKVKYLNFYAAEHMEEGVTHLGHDGYTCSMTRDRMLGRKGLKACPGSWTTTWRIFRNFCTTLQPALPSCRMLEASCSLSTESLAYTSA